MQNSNEIGYENAKTIIFAIYDYIIKFFKQSFPKYNWDQIKFNKDSIWIKAHQWLLQEHPLTNMNKIIHSFAELFPDYQNFASQLDNSLATHENMWNQVHRQLIIAKHQLK